MIGVRLTAEVPMRIVGSPAYFARRPVPTSLADLMKHNCIALRLPSSGGLYAWELAHEGKAVEARVRGQAVFTNLYHMLDAALHGVGLAFLPASLVDAHLEAGRLLAVMPEWCAPFEPLHAFYPSRRHSSRALMLVIDAIRCKQ